MSKREREIGKGELEERKVGKKEDMTDENKDMKNENEEEEGRDDVRVLTIGISGCSSSGKTTLARGLRDLFSSVTSSTCRARTSDLACNSGSGSTTTQKELKKEEETKMTKVVLIHQDDFYRDVNW